MGQGLRSPVQIYLIPPGTRYLVVSSEGDGGSQVADALGQSTSMHIVVGEYGVNVFIDNEAHRTLTEHPVVKAAKELTAKYQRTESPEPPR